MSNMTFPASVDSIPQMLAFIESEFKPKPYASCNLDTMKSSAEEILKNIAAIDRNCGPIILSVDIHYGGTGLQFMHTGPIYNPCPSDGHASPFTSKEMDETSFEFKYGRNVFTAFKKLPTANV